MQLLTSFPGSKGAQLGIGRMIIPSWARYNICVGRKKSRNDK